MDVGLRCGIRLDPSSTDDLAGLAELLNVSDSHDCVIGSGDFKDLGQNSVFMLQISSV